MAAATSWIVAQSEQALKQNINAYSKHALIDNISSADILPRRLKFVKPTKAANARPETASSTSSSSSTPPRLERQRSDFNAASIQLFDESDIIPLMQWRKAVNDHGAGLRNLGNSCFMNATLQCLCYTAPFQNYIATKHHTKLCKTSGYCIFCELVKLMPQMLYNQNTAVPKTIFMNLRMLSKKLRPGRQEDAQEFLRFLMEGLQNSCLKQEGRKIKDMRIQETTYIHKLWGGYLRSQIKCTKCGYESNTYDSILDISLEIKGPSVHTAFKHFTDPEILDDDNKYQCDNCKKKRRAIKQFTIFEPPNVLVIHLKRFECGGGGLFSGGKINKFVKFEDHLDLTEFMSYQTCPKVSYSLFGVLVHYGYSSHGGHYVSYIKAPDQRWYLMDDSSCRPANIQTVLKEKAYLLFYQRNEPKVLYQSPTVSPKLKHIISKKPSITTNMRRNNASISSFDSLQELADHLPKNADLLYKKSRPSPYKESPQLSGSKRSLSNRYDSSNLLPAKKSRSSSEDTTPKLAPLRNRISVKESTTKNLMRNSKSLLNNDSSEDIDMPRTHKYNLRSLSSSQTKDSSLEWQKDGTDGNGNEEKSMSSPSSISGEKRKHSSDEEEVIGEVSNIIPSPSKKRRIINGTSMPIKVDKESCQRHLRLLKNRKLKHRRSSLNSLPSISSTQSGSASSSPSYNTSWSYGTGRAANKLRRLNANKLVGRRSNTLKLAAKSSLHASPRRIWNRRAEKRASQLSAEQIHHLHKWKASVPVQAALSDSSSESVLSDLNHHPHKSTPSMVSDDSSGSISPQTFSPNPANPHINTTLPSHDGSSPHTLLPMPSSTLGLDGKLPKLFNTNINTNTSSSSTQPEKRSIIAPVHSIKNITKHKILSRHSIPDRPRPQKSTLITDQNVIDKYLRDEASESSAIGIGNVAAWSEDADNGQETRKLIVNRAKEPIVPEKDEWDLALDSGLAYPHKPKSARDPFKHFDRENHVNRFQSKQQAQISGLDKLKKNKKKKGNHHNKNRYYNRKRRNSLHA